MANVYIECANPTEMRLKITTELTVGEWQRILKLTSMPNSEIQYYGPLNDLLSAIRIGIRAICEREAVQFGINPEQPQ